TPCPCRLTWWLWVRIPAHTRLLPCQELLGAGAHRAPSGEAQPDALYLPVLARLAQQHTAVGQGVGVGSGLGDLLLDQAHRPGRRVGLGEATPPGLIRAAQRPVRLPSGQSDQAVTLPLFRAYTGSGLVIQCLARSQPTPRRSRLWRKPCRRTPRSTSLAWYTGVRCTSSLEPSPLWRCRHPLSMVRCRCAARRPRKWQMRVIRPSARA